MRYYSEQIVHRVWRGQRCDFIYMVIISALAWILFFLRFVSLFLSFFCFKELAWHWAEWGGGRKIPFWQDTANAVFSLQLVILKLCLPPQCCLREEFVSFPLDFLLSLIHHSFLVVQFRGVITFLYIVIIRLAFMCKTISNVAVVVCISRFMVQSCAGLSTTPTAWKNNAAVGEC